MSRCLISFDEGAMNFPGADLPDLAKASYEVVGKARDASVCVFGGGLSTVR